MFKKFANKISALPILCWHIFLKQARTENHVLYCQIFVMLSQNKGVLTILTLLNCPGGVAVYKKKREKKRGHYLEPIE